MSSPSNPHNDQRDAEEEIAALIAETMRLQRSSRKRGHYLLGLPEPDLPDLREQASALVHEGFQLSGPEDPAIDPANRELIERLQAKVLAKFNVEHAPSAP